MSVAYVWAEARFIADHPPSTTDYPDIPADAVYGAEAMCNCFEGQSNEMACTDACKMKMKKQAGLIKLMFLLPIGPIIWTASDFGFSISENNPDAFQFDWYSDADDKCLTPDPSKCPTQS
jgi:hypothetical protein